MATALASSALSHPRFRTDLVAEPIEDEGQRYIDVIDPDTGSAFRFYEVEYSIACAMDGERDVTGLCDWAREELGIATTAEELGAVIATLGDLGYLEAGAPEIAVPARPPAPRPADELELGVAGAGIRAPEPAMPRADVELGRAGAAAPGSRPSIQLPQGPAQGPAPGSAKPPAPAPQPVRTEDSQAGSVMEFEALTPPPEEMPVRPILRPITRADLEEDGPTNLPRPAVGDFDDEEVSVDLTDHVQIRPADVKEAVRQSQVMKAVEVPPELADQLDDREKLLAAAAEAAKQAARDRAATIDRPTKPMEVVRPGSEPVTVRVDRMPVDDEETIERPAPPELLRPAELPKPPPGPAEARLAAAAPLVPEPPKLPVELPRAPVAVSRPRARQTTPRPVEAPAVVPVPPALTAEPAKGTSPLLIAFLVLVILAVGAFFIWRYVFATPSNEAVPPQPSGIALPPTTPAPTPTPPTPEEKPAPPPPAPPSATLAGGAAGAVEIKSPGTGAVAYTVAAGTIVNAGDPVAKLGGYQRFEQKLGDGKTGGLLWDIDKRVPREIEKHQASAAQARTAGNEGLAKAYEKKAEERTLRLDQKKKERDDALAALDKLLVKAPQAGKIKTVIGSGKRVAEGDVVASIEGTPTLTATFKVDGASSKTYATEQPVRVSAKGDPSKQASCTVTAVQGSDVTVSCPADAGVAAGDEVVLQ